ncbi:MAG: hypothetical protein C0592_06820 [Marinilabiliales bacterium]|nr:MAG: hypothetical protein C0592_06820 [Marinilabiliales bacterium]
MRQLAFISIITLIITSCGSRPDYTPKYENFANDLEKENLIGNVKSIELYVERVVDYQSGKTKQPVLKHRKEFNSAGFMTSAEYYDAVGQLDYSILKEYNENNYNIKNTTQSVLMNMMSIEECKYDSSGNVTEINSTTNDSIDLTIFFMYDEHGSVIKHVLIQNGDTIIKHNEYEYDSENRVIKSTHFESDDFEEINETRTYKYDNNGNLVEIINTSNIIGTLKTVNIFNEDNILVRIETYENGKIHMEVEYDDYYNEVNRKIYSNGVLQKEMKYEYEFDKNGNWISRDVLLKDHLNKSSSFIKLSTETREIVYY